MGSRYRLTTSWAILSATVGIPNGPVSVLLSPFGLSTLRTGGGKWLPEASRLRARPCSVFGRPVHLSGLLPLIPTRWFSSSPSDPASRQTPCPPKIRRWRLQVSLSVSRLSPSCLTSLSIPFHHLRPVRHYPHLWISARGFGRSGTSTHLTRQLSGTHYGSVRPCAPHRYSGPCRFRRLGFSLGIRASGSCSSAQTPASESRPLYAGRRLPSHQAPDRLVPEGIHAPGFDDTIFFTTRLRRVHFRSSLGCSLLKAFLELFPNAHDRGSLPQQLGVV